jgi:hypothetical protein
VAFLDEVAARQAEIAEAAGDGDDEAHVGGGEAVERRLVAILMPADGEVVFFTALEIGGAHGGPDELAWRSGKSAHLPLT